MSFVKVQNKVFVLEDREILFAGLGLGSWLNMEHFMLGIPTTDTQIRKVFQDVFGKETASAFFHKFIMNFIGENDFKFLKEMGINLVRVPFNYHLFFEDNAPDVYKEEGFLYFDRLFDLAKKYQIFILPDLHTAPGGQNPDWHSDNTTGFTQFWHYKVFQDQVVSLWQVFAKRYKDEPFLLGYDILNEPFLIPKTDILNDFYEEVTKAIRSVDTNHIIFIEGDFFSMDFSSIHSIEDKQTALAFHFYPTVWEKNLFSKEYDRTQRKMDFDAIFMKLTQIREQFGIPILCGEAGYDIDQEDISFTMGLVEDTLDIFRKYKVSWTLWSYKDAAFMGMVYPKKESGWMKFTDKIHQYWNHYQDTSMAEKIIENLCKEYFPKASKEDKYHLTFSQRSLIYYFQAEYWLKPELMKMTKDEILMLPDSFLFEQCEFYKEYETILKGFHF